MIKANKITKNTRIEFDLNTKNLTNKQYFIRKTGSKRRSHKSYTKNVAKRKCIELQSDIDNGLIKY